MLLFFVYLLFSVSHARRCCPACTCSNRCEAPHVTASLNTSGLVVHCPNADCACVTDELDTCTYGQMWTNVTGIGWKDPRWHKCVKIESLAPLRARAMIRWWRNKCMGHIMLILNINTIAVTRDLYVDFNVLAFFEHDTIYNVYRIKTKSGSSDERPMAGSSNMFFEAELSQDQTGVHVEITNCTVQVVEGKEVDAPVINEINVFDEQNLEATENGMRMNYQAFWDDETNSPFQRLVCKYALFNGTNNEFILHNSVNRTYMMADPNENGILLNGQDDEINNGL